MNDYKYKQYNQEMSNLNTLIENINEVCQKIAERDGFKLPPVGGYIKKPNQGGGWTFVEGKGSYEYKDGDWQWKLS